MVSIRYVYISWGEAINMSYKLTSKILESNYVPDTIVAISRGGLIPARIISDVINVSDVHSIKASLWGVGGRISDDVLLYNVELPIRGKKVLVVDDIVDSGLTLTRIVEYVKTFGPEDLKTAVLHIKPSSKYIPNYYVSRLEEWLWVIYPWTIHEVIYSIIYKHYGCDSTSFNINTIINEFSRLTGVNVDELDRRSLNIAKHLYLDVLCGEE